MSFGLSRGRELDVAPGVVAVSRAELGPLPDEVARDPRAGRVDVRGWFREPGNPLEIEVGSGKGTFLVQQASLQPGTNYLGIEYQREFFEYAADRVRRHGLANVRMLGTDAGEFITWRVPDGIVRTIHLYFPDPWPKRRHHKRRMVQDRFLAHAWRVLEPRGELRIVTDHDDYWAWMEEHFARWTGEAGSDTLRARIGVDAAGPPFERVDFARPGSAGEGEVVGTNFERKYRREGRPFHAAVLRKGEERQQGSGVMP